MGQAEEQQAATLVAKPVAQEQIAAAHILREHMGDPGVDRDEVRELRKFLKEPLVGAGIQTLRRGLKTFAVTSDAHALIAAVRELAQQQYAPTISVDPAVRLRREDLYLICYEYICS